jgi:hypothetical protein
LTVLSKDFSGADETASSHEAVALAFSLGFVVHSFCYRFAFLGFEAFGVCLWSVIFVCCCFGGGLLRGRRRTAL